MKKISIITLLIMLSLFSTGCNKTVDIDLTQATNKISSVTNTVKKIINKLKDLNVDVNKSKGKHVVIVPGYGAPVEGNSGYEGYIEEVAAFVNDKNNEVDLVIFTGSYSSLKDTSESESMNDYFNNVLISSNSDISIYQEKCAIVSWQNISNSKDILDEHGISARKITIFGDQAREEKLKAFATYKFNESQISKKDLKDMDISLVYTDIDFTGYDFGTNESEQAALIAAEMAGAYDAKTGNAILGARIKEWTATYGYDIAQNLVDKGCSEYKGFL